MITLKCAYIQPLSLSTGHHAVSVYMHVMQFTQHVHFWATTLVYHLSHIVYHIYTKQHSHAQCHVKVGCMYIPCGLWCDVSPHNTHTHTHTQCTHSAHTHTLYTHTQCTHSAHTQTLYTHTQCTHRAHTQTLTPHRGLSVNCSCSQCTGKDGV